MKKHWEVGLLGCPLAKLCTFFSGIPLPFPFNEKYVVTECSLHQALFNVLFIPKWRQSIACPITACHTGSQSLHAYLLGWTVSPLRMTQSSSLYILPSSAWKPVRDTWLWKDWDYHYLIVATNCFSKEKLPSRSSSIGDTWPSRWAP